jgi:hypothetical protein
VRGSQSSAKYRGCQRGRTTQENQEPNPNSQKLTIKIKKDGNKKKACTISNRESKKTIKERGFQRIHLFLSCFFHGLHPILKAPPSVTIFTMTDAMARSSLCGFLFSNVASLTCGVKECNSWKKSKGQKRNMVATQPRRPTKERKNRIVFSQLLKT